MKGILTAIMAGSLVFAASTATAMSDTKTAMDSHWICTTNASSSSLEADKAADNQMANSAKSSTDAFAFASANCRDCTKITCEVQSD